MNVFSTFDWPYTVKRVAVVPGYTNSSGVWIAESIVETTTLAHISDVTQKERQFIDPGLILQGVRKLGCEKSVGFAVGDRVKIQDGDSSVSEWIVEAKQGFSGLMMKHAGISRETFLIKYTGEAGEAGALFDDLIFDSIIFDEA